MTLAVPLVSTPSQRLSVQLGAQSCSIKVYQKSTGLYLDLSILDTSIVAGALCRNDVFLVRDPASGFAGDLYFHDTQGAADPTYEDLGSRFVLLWTGG